MKKLTKKILVETIKNMNYETLKIKAGLVTFGLTKMFLHDDEVIIIGGFGTHFEIYNTDSIGSITSEEVADKIIQYMKGYDIGMAECSIEI